MTITTLFLAVALASSPVAAADGTALPLLLDLEVAPPFELELVAPTPAPSIDFEAAMEEAVQAVANGWQDRDPATGRFVEADTGTGYFGMLAGNSYDPAVLAFFAASAVEMYSAYDLRNQCAASTVVSCSDPWPSSVQQDALLTAGVYAGVTGLQRLAKTQWGIDMDEGWKNVLIFGSLAAVRSLLSASNISDANALRELGR
ncbi:MAG: hypothetical protein GY898_23045 [Proteobacteria bacterium]|nr:hypothetical protein [Pseudomonadota bacterium]